LTDTVPDTVPDTVREIEQEMLLHYNQRGFNGLIKLEQLPELNQECKSFLTQDLREFEEKGTMNESLDDYFIQLKRFLNKAKEAADKIEFNVYRHGHLEKRFSKSIEKSFKKWASNCVHRLIVADKWIGDRVRFVDNPRDFNILIKMQQGFNNAIKSIGSRVESKTIKWSKQDSKDSNMEDDYRVDFIQTISNSIDKLNSLIKKNILLQCFNGFCQDTMESINSLKHYF